MTKAERIIANARKNPTKRNVAMLANLCEKMIQGRKRKQKTFRRMEEERSHYARIYNNHEWDVATGRKSCG